MELLFENTLNFWFNENTKFKNIKINDLGALIAAQTYKNWQQLGVRSHLKFPSWQVNQGLVKY